MYVIHLEELKQLDKTNEYAIYGAASTGEICYKILKENGYEVTCFLDDDSSKIGKLFWDKKITSSENFISECADAPIHIIAGSIYINSIIRRLEKVSGNSRVAVYDISRLYESEKYELQKQFMIVQDADFVWKNIDKLYEICPDDESHKIIDVMKKVYKEQYTRFDVYKDIMTREEQYFTADVISFLSGRRADIVDGGAFQGEIINDLCSNGINFGNLYLFEVNKENYGKLLRNIESAALGGVYPINKGLWDKNGKVYLEGEGEACRIVGYETDDSMEVTTIDCVVGNGNINLIKMDIEGAEMHALRGGLKTIERCRPALAITIYHSPEDFVGIPIFLQNNLDSYSYRLLHHTNEYVETILYAMPK